MYVFVGVKFLASKPNYYTLPTYFTYNNKKFDTFITCVAHL